VHRVEVEPANEDERGNGDLGEPVQGGRLKLTLVDVVPVRGHLECPPLNAPDAFT
jgi:hypothetical protein